MKTLTLKVYGRMKKVSKIERITHEGREYVKVHIIGKKFEWDEFIPIEIFLRENPEVVI